MDDRTAIECLRSYAPENSECECEQCKVWRHGIQAIETLAKVREELTAKICKLDERCDYALRTGRNDHLNEASLIRGEYKALAYKIEKWLEAKP